MTTRGIGIHLTLPEGVLNLLEKEAKLSYRNVQEVIRFAIEAQFGEKLRAQAEAKYGAAA